MRSVLPRPTLPSGRAMVGGIIVAIAFLGAWWLSSGDADRPSSTVPVARRDLTAGERLDGDAIRWVPMDVPSGLATPTIRPADDASDLVALAPMASGELIQASDVGLATPGSDGREVSFVVGTQFAAGGRVQRGDRIDVLVTYGEGTSSSTTRVLSNIEVHDVSDRDDAGLGGEAGLTITVALSDGDDVLALTNASQAGAITVARSTGAAAAGTGTEFHPPSDAAGTDETPAEGQGS